MSVSENFIKLEPAYDRDEPDEVWGQGNQDAEWMIVKGAKYYPTDVSSDVDDEDDPLVKFPYDYCS